VGSGHESARSPSLRRQLAVGAAVASLCALLLVFFGVAGSIIDVPYELFTREVAKQAGLPSYVGALAHATWFLWAAAITAGLLGAVGVHRARPGDRRVAFFLATSALSLLLLVDDFAMIHDQWFERWGVPQEPVYLLYAVILVVLLVRYRDEFVHGGLVLAGAAGAFWALSIAMDVVADQGGLHLVAVEDGAKLIGTALWAVFMAFSALQALERPEPAPR
jgi:hypothetical protein